MSSTRADSERGSSVSVEAFNKGGENAGAKITRTQQARILCSTCLAAFTIVGLTQAFGVFQAHYARPGTAREGILNAHETDRRALISTIGSLGNGGIVAAFAVFYYPHLPQLGMHIRTLCSVGTVLIVAGFAIAAASRSLWHLIACQGVLVGVGSGILLYVLAPILPEYFPKHPGRAQGTMFTFAAVGGTVFALAITELLEKVGARVTLGIVSAISFVLLSTASLLTLPPRQFERRSTKMVSLGAFKEPLFACLFIVNIIHPLTLAVPMVFGPEFAESLGMTITKASLLLSVNNGVGIVSRLPVGMLSDRIGHQNTIILATSIYALATWGLWLPSALSSNQGLYIGLCVCHGLINGVFNIVMNSVQKELFGDEMYYPKNGAMTTIRGIGYVAGVPIAGALVRNVAETELKSVDFSMAIVYVGALLTISLLCLLNVRRLDAKQSGWRWIR